MSISKISTIIFDAGGVLLYIKRRRNDIVKELLLSMGYNIDSINNAIMAGNEFDEKYFSNEARIYNWKDEKNWLIGHYNAIAKCVDEKNDYLADKLFMLTFDTYEYVIYPKVIEVLETLKDNYKLGIISNALPSLDWAFDTLGIRKYFDNIIISAYEGVEKPDETIYFSAVDKLGCKFEECIFIDDKIENVQAAEKLGMKGFYLDRKEYTLKAVLDLLDDKFDVA
ncbi:phosphatase [Clostridium tepidiprofundi DSM 19306]|uniref:Phosphatase n=1 Tax=Clostridium tepidiprofundi DSM 19306 TaxID=1121338 RepID=A0A151B6K8_9CLOT|nr:HAD-IA family hydrolase [Clostridium tepidiprofundi]KYH35529.1 phosphatase [Clostridium tepidiprofundi DSM 19306]